MGDGVQPRAQRPAMIVEPLQRVLPAAAIDLGRQRVDAVAPRIADDHLRRVEAHGLLVEQRAVESRRMVAFQPERLVGDEGKAGGVRFAKAVARKAGKLGKDRLGCGRVDLLLRRAAHEAGAHGRHLLLRAGARERAAQAVGLARRKAGRSHRHADRLLLKEQHAQRLAQHRLQAGMQIAHRLLAGAAAQVGMHRATLDRPRPHDGDLDGDVLEAERLEARQHLLLGAALHLESADGVGLVQHAVDGGVVERQRVEVGHGIAGTGDVAQRLAHQPQRAQRQQVDLDQPGILHTLLVPLADKTAGHGRRLQRHDGVEWGAGDQHAAAVDRKMARAARDVAEKQRQEMVNGQW